MQVVGKRVGVCAIILVGFAICAAPEWTKNTLKSQDSKGIVVTQPETGSRGSTEDEGIEDRKVLPPKVKGLTGSPAAANRPLVEFLGSIDWNQSPPYNANYYVPYGAVQHSPEDEIGTLGSLNPSDVYRGGEYAPGNSGSKELDLPGSYSATSVAEVYPEALFFKRGPVGFDLADPQSEQSVPAPPYKNMVRKTSTAVSKTLGEVPLRSREPVL